MHIRVVVETSLLIPVVLLLAALACLGWAALPARSYLYVRGQWSSQLPMRGRAQIEAQVIGGHRVIARPHPNGEFLLALPIGCSAVVRFMLYGKEARTMMIEHRLAQGANLDRKAYQVELPDLWPDNQVAIRSVTLHDSTCIVTECAHSARQAPLDRQLFDRLEHLFGTASDIECHDIFTR